MGKFLASRVKGRAVVRKATNANQKQAHKKGSAAAIPAAAVRGTRGRGF
jgi:hypothetical protein